MNKTDPDFLNILLVDDEPKVINGLERNLSITEDGWDINVAYSGQEALELLDEEPVDIIVSDLRMPEMDGSQFLERAKVQCPNSIRFILSGYADQDLMLKATGVAHRYLTKPCDSQELIDAIRQVFETRSLMANEEIAHYVNDTGELHADNKALQQILDLTNDPESDLDELARLIESQPTVHASILHVANTAFFGAGGQVETVNEAMQTLGLEFLRSLAILELSKSRLELPPDLMVLAETVLNHCVETSLFARQMKPLLEKANMLQTLTSLCLLHDLGKLVFLIHEKENYAELWKQSAAQKTPLWKLEQEAYGCDHAGIGAYLFDLWGLPEALIRGVAWHHKPLKVVKDSFCPVSLLHMANYAAHEIKELPLYCSGDLDAILAERFSISPHFHNELN